MVDNHLENIRRRTMQAKSVLLQNVKVGGHNVSVTLELARSVEGLHPSQGLDPLTGRPMSGPPPTPRIVGGEHADQTAHP